MLHATNAQLLLERFWSAQCARRSTQLTATGDRNVGAECRVKSPDKQRAKDIESHTTLSSCVHPVNVLETFVDVEPRDCGRCGVVNEIFVTTKTRRRSFVSCLLALNRLPKHKNRSLIMSAPAIGTLAVLGDEPICVAQSSLDGQPFVFNKTTTNEPRASRLLATSTAIRERSHTRCQRRTSTS